MKYLFEKLLQTARIKPKPAPDPTAPRYADFMDRVFAAAVDVLILYFLLFPLFAWIQQKIYLHVDWDVIANDEEGANASLTHTLQVLAEGGYLQLWFLNAMIQVFIIGIIMVGTQLHFHTTPGKHLMGLKVADAITLGAPKPWQYVVRFIGYIPATLSLMIGIIWISFNRQHRGWHDYMARTVVLNTRPHDWYWQQIKRGFKWLKGKLTASK